MRRQRGSATGSALQFDLDFHQAPVRSKSQSGLGVTQSIHNEEMDDLTHVLSLLLFQDISGGAAPTDEEVRSNIVETLPD